MATVINETEIQPAVTMNKIHIDSFVFKQKREANPKRQISMAFCLYGEDPNGNRIFSKKTEGVNDDDMDMTVAAAALEAGQTIEEFMTEYASVKANITADYAAGNISDTEIMVFFELAMARVAELNGKLTIASVE